MDKLLHALGLCAKAGKLVMGTPMICEALTKKTKPLLVLIASDNSPNTAKRLQDKSQFYQVRTVTLSIGGEELAHAVGKSGHLAAVAVTDENFCRLIDGVLQK